MPVCRSLLAASNITGQYVCRGFIPLQTLTVSYRTNRKGAQKHVVSDHSLCAAVLCCHGLAGRWPGVEDSPVCEDSGTAENSYHPGTGDTYRRGVCACFAKWCFSKACSSPTSGSGFLAGCFITACSWCWRVTCAISQTRLAWVDIDSAIWKYAAFAMVDRSAGSVGTSFFG